MRRKHRPRSVPAFTSYPDGARDNVATKDGEDDKMAMKLGSPEDVEDRRACQRWASQCMNSDLGFVYISENDNPIKWEGHMTDEEMRRYGWTRRRILAHCQAVTRSVLANRISSYSIGDKPDHGGAHPYLPVFACSRHFNLNTF